MVVNDPIIPLLFCFGIVLVIMGGLIFKAISGKT